MKYEIPGNYLENEGPVNEKVTKYFTKHKCVHLECILE